MFHDSVRDVDRASSNIRTNTPHAWQRVGACKIDDVSDKELAEFCIGEQITLCVPPNAWKGHPQSYIATVIDCRKDKHGLKAKLVIYEEDKSSSTWWSFINVSQPSTRVKSNGLTLRELVVRTHPNMTCLWDATARVSSTKPPLRDQLKRTKTAAGFFASSLPSSVNQSAIQCACGVFHRCLCFGELL